MTLNRSKDAQLLQRALMEIFAKRKPQEANEILHAGIFLRLSMTKTFQITAEEL